MDAVDELDLTHLNDGILTRIPCPLSRGSAVDLPLTSGRTRFDFDRTVLDDSAGSYHNPILINLSSSSNIRLPLRPPNPIPHILDWRCYADATNEGFSNINIESVDDKNIFLIELITQSSRVDFLLELYNDSLNAGQTPVDWKRTRIVTILKPGKDPALVDSYRPISLLSCIRKLFKRMLLMRLELCAEKSGIFGPSLALERLPFPN
jgi:hypothetical protein